ncbi:MAG: hypothetical protein ACOYWZ_01245 [Bacillota bacterium]
MKRSHSFGCCGLSFDIYDEFDRLKTISIDTKDSQGTVKSTHITTYTYDKNGNVASETNRIKAGTSESASTYTYVYDSQNRLIEKSDAYNVVQRLAYYDNGLQKDSYDAPNSTGSTAFRLTQYQYDKNGRLILTIDPVNSIDSSLPSRRI